MEKKIMFHKSSSAIKAVLATAIIWGSFSVAFGCRIFNGTHRELRMVQIPVNDTHRFNKQIIRPGCSIDLSLQDEGDSTLMLYFGPFLVGTLYAPVCSSPSGEDRSFIDISNDFDVTGNRVPPVSNKYFWSIEDDRAISLFFTGRTLKENGLLYSL